MINKFPHPKAKDILRISRIVILPEFQGYGLGIKFMNKIANLYPDNRVRIITSLKPFIQALDKNKNWVCKHFGRLSKGSKSGGIHNKNVKNSTSNNRITATFEYKNNG